jgi:hypothetical protein
MPAVSKRKLLACINSMVIVVNGTDDAEARLPVINGLQSRPDNKC